MFCWERNLDVCGVRNGTIWSILERHLLIAVSKPTVSVLPGDRFCSILTSRCVQRPKLFGISAANSLLWQAGNWALTESELSRRGSWGARKFYAMSCKKRSPEPLHWRSLETYASCGARTGGTFFAGNIVLLVTSRVFNMVPSRLLVLYAS